MPETDRNRAKFDTLRARYLAARTKRDDLDLALSSRYGSGYQPSWLGAKDRAALERARTALDKAGEAVFAHVQAISPRDWSYGVPSAWVRGELTYEDATRPTTETLSVVPPLSYGSTHPRT